MIVQTTTKATQITVDNTPFFAIIFGGDFDRLKLGNLNGVLSFPFERLFHFFKVHGYERSLNRWCQCVSIGGHNVSNLRNDEIN